MKHNPPLVLVADDEHSAATMLKHIFEREHFQVQIAQDGPSALEMSQRIIPDLIILDIMMPNMNGFEVLEQLRENQETVGIPTIIVSARHKEPHEVAKGLNIGADDYMAKPFAPQELVARAKSKLRAKELEEALQKRTQELEALLRVSEQLNKHLEAEEILSLIIKLTRDLLTTDLALICRFDGNGNLVTFSAHINDDDVQHEPDDFEAHALELQNMLLQLSPGQVEEATWINLPHSMVVALSHADQTLGALLIANNSNVYDESEKMLLMGIGRQAGMALHNAELYEIQLNYALHLEDMVNQRTEELKATQQMLLRSEKLASIGHLAANIAHEINNPLQPIRLNLEFLLDDADSGQPIDHELVRMTQGSVERISRIVRQLLEFTKTGKSDAFATVDIQDVLRGVIKLNERAFQRDGITIKVDMEPIPTTLANKDQLEQVFMNLLINAKGAMVDGGEMEIRVWHEVDKIRVQFKDTGSGIPEDMLDKIFDPFVSTKPDGTGLGLFVTYSIIESHQGHIDVRSKVGAGTTFTVTLPVLTMSDQIPTG